MKRQFPTHILLVLRQDDDGGLKLLSNNVKTFNFQNSSEWSPQFSKAY